MSFLNQTKTKKAICYYRHSAEDKQENSVPIQREHAQNFAGKHNIEIIHEEADQGVSGLIANRPGFKRLLMDWVQNPQAPEFDYVLFYDISRWGRFQDQNEGAHYAFVCKQHGKTLVNVSRGFPQEGQEMMTSMMDSFDRIMAAEYSRVLSGKVWYGCMKISRDGYSAGGTSCYGMARLLLDENKKPIRLLKKGEHKVIANERVTFTPLNDETTEAVKNIFNLFVNHWQTPNEIASKLNAQGIPSANGGLWNRSKIIRILTNETYAGTRVYNKTWGRLKQTNRPNPRNEWVITPNAFPAVIDAETFKQTQERLYWLIPTRWKRGIYTIRRVSRFLEAEVKDIFLQKGLAEDDVKLLLKTFPLTLSAGFYRDAKPSWCFVIPEQMRQYDWVIGVSIVMDKREPLDRFFLLPTKDFNTSNFLFFGENDDSYVQYKTEVSNVENFIQSLPIEANP
jgi:DNA invertase Pin-like site-specific DNA recombinase